jgi:hypothetical protein
MSEFSKHVASGDFYKVFNHPVTYFKSTAVIQAPNVQSEQYYRPVLYGNYIIMDRKGYERTDLRYYATRLDGLSECHDKPV